MINWLKKLFKNPDEAQYEYWVQEMDGAREYYIQAELFDRWYPISPEFEVRVNSFDPIGNFWIRERKV